MNAYSKAIPDQSVIKNSDSKTSLKLKFPFSNLKFTLLLNLLSISSNIFLLYLKDCMCGLKLTS